MMSKPERVVPLAFPPQPNVIATLEDLLARAQTGEIQALGVAWIERTPQGDVTSVALATGKNTWWSTLAGAIARLAYTLQRRMDEQA